MEIVNSKDGIKKLIGDLSKHSENNFITVDTEFIRESKQIPLLSLLQIASESEIYIVDPISVNIDFLKPFFSDGNLKKVFHSAKQDIEILKNYGFEINNIHDTQLYEMVLSPKENISYQTIVFNYLGKVLKKKYGLSDWSRRPLSKKQLSYSSEDVIYLREVYVKQSELLKKSRRENWLDDEINLLAQGSSRDHLEKSVPRETLDILHKLIDWREEKAKSIKIIPELFVSDRMIKSICKKGLKFVNTLKNSRDMEDANIQEFLNYAESIIENTPIEQKFSERISEVSLMKALLDLKSEENNIAPSIIATSEDLRRFINGDNSVKFLKDWRKEIFGNFAKLLLEGRIKLGIQNNRAIIYE